MYIFNLPYICMVIIYTLLAVFCLRAADFFYSGMLLFSCFPLFKERATTPLFLRKKPLAKKLKK